MARGVSQKLLMACALVIALAVGSIQGHRLDQIRDATKFYRWMLSASIQSRVFSDGVGSLEGTDGQEGYLDNALFDRIIERTETLILELPEPTEDELDENGNPLPKIMRLTKFYAAGEGQDDVAETLDSKEQLKRDRILWKIARGNDLADIRSDFLIALRDRRIASAGSQMDLNTIYGGSTDFGVSIANIFFGFRKMAANLVWLEVEQFWHSGQYFRMVPAMKTTVILDPTFIDAYLLGAWHLAYNWSADLDATPWDLRVYHAPHKAWVGEKELLYYDGIDFLKDGIQNNPRNYKIWFDAGYGIYEEKLKDHANAVLFLREAIRPKHDVWVRRTLYRIMEYNEQYEEAMKGWTWYIEKFPDNAVAPRFYKRSFGLAKERDAARAAVRAEVADRLADRAEQAGDANQGAQWRDEATNARANEQRLLAEARDTWNEMNEMTGGKDVFAPGRLHKQDALKMAEKDRYEEAVALLDIARWESNAIWNEATELMLDYKITGNLPLSETEVRHKFRRVKERRYKSLLPRPLDGITYEHIEKVWRPVRPRAKAYDGTVAQALLPDSEEALELVFQHPEIARPLKLGGRVIVHAGQQWYEYRGEPLQDVIDPEELDQ